ncbi:ATP-binding protein [Roseateles saccharophilus]|uniref:histidine kinase n=1 Tax=Roseateles saccharophilus TaxID=304 RepID=A0A4R3VAI9_ROSSA|nr:ATP-binding protein [Roseateles saccharophilus]MDG0835595.1 PAS domain S-box protein [Roseateles saccharophilus]TCV01041.1 PAS domain S-box-containing protein [Roseateles saccharophilus]
MAAFIALFPRSLVGRVLLLYMAALTLLVTLAFGIFIAYEFNSSLEDAEADSQAMLAMLAPAMADSAVIGDYDTIKRTLDRAIAHPLFQRAAFIDLKGGRIEVVRQDHPSPTPPDWLVARIAAQLEPANATISVGGRDYGVTRLTPWGERIAADIWQVVRLAMLFSVVGTLAGGALVWWPLRRWLGQLDRVRDLGARLQQGGGQAIQPMRTDEAPLEFQRTFEIVNQVAASLQAERAQAAVTLASIAEGVATVNRAGDVVLANPVLGRLLGSSSPALLGRAVAELLPELDIDPAADTGWQGRRFERGEQVLEASLAPVRSEQGEAAGAVLVLRDVSKQQALEDRLRAELDTRAHAMQAMSELLGSAGSAPSAAHSNAIEQLSRQVGDMVARLRRQTDQLHAIFNLTPDGFISFDAERRVQYVSPACALLTALADRDVLGRDEAGLEDLLQGRFAEAGTQRPLRLQELRDEPRIMRMARPMPRILSFALHDGGGAETPQLLHIRDVSQQFEVDRLKSEFLTTAAHELRTPMTSIFGFTELLIHREHPPKTQRELLQRVHRQSRAMMDILDELLDLARIESRHALDFQFRPAALQGLVRQTVGDFGVPEGREPPALALPEAPLWVHVDTGKLGQALRNLLSNAYKYSPGGGGVALRVAPNGPGHVDIEIEDHGIGMTPQELERAAERFYRADKSGAIPGTGLGMAIVKEIVELMGGSLHLRSEPGRGTTATLRLRLTAAPATAPATSAAGAA